MQSGRILVLGASGYIGSQLVSALLEKGFPLRAAAKRLSKLRKSPWGHQHPGVEVMETDVLDKQSLCHACRGCDVVYYLVHSMNLHIKDFAQADRQAAHNMVEVAQEAGIKRIIYLGGLGEDEKTLSKHLRSRMEVLHILHSGKVPVTSFRAAMIIGRGSVSFEIMRMLVTRLPVLIAPYSISTQSQPIAFTNVIYYLTACLQSEATLNQTFDIGGPDILTYRELMDICVEEAGLKKRFIITVPPAFISALGFWWIKLVAPYPIYIVKPLVDGIKNRVVCQDNRIREILPQKLLDCRQAMQMALH